MDAVNRFFQGIFYFFFVFLILACGENAYKELTSKTTDDALLFDAKTYINQGEYTLAIAKIAAMSASAQSAKETQRVLGSAYAGRCGFVFITFINNLGSATGSLFAKFMKSFTTTLVNPEDCYNAQRSLEVGYGTSTAGRPNDISFLLALLGIAKAGTYLRADGDVDKNGTVDATFSACTVSATAGVGLSDADVKQIITGLGLVIENIASISSTLSGATSTAITDLQTACSAIPGDPLAGCAITDPNSATLNAAAVLAMRRLLDEPTYGIGACADATTLTCCP